MWPSQSIGLGVCVMVFFFVFRCPLVSLSYLPRAAVAAFPYGGLLAGTLENASFWELKTDFSHKPHVLSLEPGGFVDFQTESSTRHCLVTYRPGEFWSSQEPAVLVRVGWGCEFVQERRHSLWVVLVNISKADRLVVLQLLVLQWRWWIPFPPLSLLPWHVFENFPHMLLEFIAFTFRSFLSALHVRSRWKRRNTQSGF